MKQIKFEITMEAEDDFVEEAKNGSIMQIIYLT